MIQETRGLRRELFAEFRGAIINGVVGLRAPMLVELIILVGHLPFFLGQFPPLPIFAWKRIGVDTVHGRMYSTRLLPTGLVIGLRDWIRWKMFAWERFQRERRAYRYPCLFCFDDVGGRHPGMTHDDTSLHLPPDVMDPISKTEFTSSMMASDS